MGKVSENVESALHKISIILGTDFKEMPMHFVKAEST